MVVFVVDVVKVGKMIATWTEATVHAMDMVLVAIAVPVQILIQTYDAVDMMLVVLAAAVDIQIVTYAVVDMVLVAQVAVVDIQIATGAAVNALKRVFAEVSEIQEVVVRSRHLVLKKVRHVMMASDDFSFRSVQRFGRSGL